MRLNSMVRIFGNSFSCSVLVAAIWYINFVLLAFSIVERHMGNRKGSYIVINSLRPNDAYIYVSKLSIIGSDIGLSLGRRQAIIWTNSGILSIGPLGTNFTEMLTKFHAFSFKQMHLKCLGNDGHLVSVSAYVIACYHWHQPPQH